MLRLTHFSPFAVHLSVASLLLALTACGGNDISPNAGGDSAETQGDTADSSPEDDSTSSSPDDDATTGQEGGADAGPGEESEPIGDPVGELVSIDHAMVKAAIEAHVTAHIDGIDDALTFLESSDGLNNLFEILFGDTNSDSGEMEGEMEGEMMRPPSDEDDGPIFEIDLEEAREDVLEWLFDYVVVESTATLSEDGKTLTYPVTAEIFCAEEVNVEDWMSESDLSREAERAAESEAECAQQLTDSPLSLSVTTDGDDRLHLTMVAGLDLTEVFAVQLHADMVAGFVYLAGVKALLETFIDKEDFEFPDTMMGTVGVEVKNDADKQYALRVSIDEAVEMAPSAGQDALSLSLAKNLTAGGLMLDGVAGNITGDIALGQILFGIPWEMVVSITWDSEGESEWICELDDETGEENCWDEWTDGPEQPEVTGMANLVIPGVTGTIEIDSAADLFHFKDLSLGEGKLVVDKDGQSIVEVELNPNDAWKFDLKMMGDGAKATLFELSEKVEAKVVMTMDHVKDSFQDLPDFMRADAMGATMQGEEETPSMKLMRDDEDEAHIQVASGQLTLWSDSMDEDVVIEAGQCITESEAELTEEEEEALHDLLGGLTGGSCGE